MDCNTQKLKRVTSSNETLSWRRSWYRAPAGRAVAPAGV